MVMDLMAQYASHDADGWRFSRVMQRPMHCSSFFITARTEGRWPGLASAHTERYVYRHGVSK